jgi:hypothetical protein
MTKKSSTGLVRETYCDLYRGLYQCEPEEFVARRRRVANSKIVKLVREYGESAVQQAVLEYMRDGFWSRWRHPFHLFAKHIARYVKEVQQLDGKTKKERPGPDPILPRTGETYEEYKIRKQIAHDA